MPAENRPPTPKEKVLFGLIKGYYGGLPEPIFRGDTPAERETKRRPFEAIVARGATDCYHLATDGAIPELHGAMAGFANGMYETVLDSSGASLFKLTKAFYKELGFELAAPAGTTKAQETALIKQFNELADSPYKLATLLSQQFKEKKRRT